MLFKMPFEADLRWAMKAFRLDVSSANPGSCQKDILMMTKPANIASGPPGPKLVA